MAGKSCPRNVIALHKQVAWEKYGKALRGRARQTGFGALSQPSNRELATETHEMELRAREEAESQ